MVVGDLPFGSYQCGDDEAMRNAVACLKAGADAVKLEGGSRVTGLIRRMCEAGIPVVAHIGMTPQSVNEYGGFRKQGKTREEAERILADAHAVQAAGAFAVTLECIPAELAAAITSALSITTIGIGAGPVCDAQWLVMHDLLGLSERSPSFAKCYANLSETHGIRGVCRGGAGRDFPARAAAAHLIGFCFPWLSLEGGFRLSEGRDLRRANDFWTLNISRLSKVVRCSKTRSRDVRGKKISWSSFGHLLVFKNHEMLLAVS